MIAEEEEPQEEPPEPPYDTPDEAPVEMSGEEKEPEGQEHKAEGPEVQEAQEPCQGKVRRLTDYFNKLGGSRTPMAPTTPQKTPKTPVRRTSTQGSGGVKKTRRRGKPKLDEAQRSKLELAMKNFLRKKPPDKHNGGGEYQIYVCNMTVTLFIYKLHLLIVNVIIMIIAFV